MRFSDSHHPALVVKITVSIVPADAEVLAAHANALEGVFGKTPASPVMQDA